MKWRLSSSIIDKIIKLRFFVNQSKNQKPALNGIHKHQQNVKNKCYLWKVSPLVEFCYREIWNMITGEHYSDITCQWGQSIDVSTSKWHIDWVRFFFSKSSFLLFLLLKHKLHPKSSMLNQCPINWVTFFNFEIIIKAPLGETS